MLVSYLFSYFLFFIFGKGVHFYPISLFSSFISSFLILLLMMGQCLWYGRSGNRRSLPDVGSIYDDFSTLNQHWVDVWCLLGDPSCSAAGCYSTSVNLHIDLHLTSTMTGVTAPDWLPLHVIRIQE